MTINNTQQYKSFKDAIEMGVENSLIIDNLSYKTNYLDKIIFNTEEILRQKYRLVILQNCVEIELDDSLFNKYKFRPKYLSLDLYGTIDLWHLILWVNDMTSVTQFNRKKIKVPMVNITNVINKLINREQENLEINNESPTKIIEKLIKIRR